MIVGLNITYVSGYGERVSLFTYDGGKAPTFVSSVQTNTGPRQTGVAWHYRARSRYPWHCLTLREKSPAIPKLGAPFWHTLCQIGAGAWALALGVGVLGGGRHGRADGLHRTPDTGHRVRLSLSYA